MEEGEYTYQAQGFSDASIRTRDLEEKQRILKDRILLIGQNLIETKEETQEKIAEKISRNRWIK